MTLDERLVDLLVQAEEWQQEGRLFTVAELCPDQPELWDPLQEMLAGMQQLAGVMCEPEATHSATGPVTLTAAPPIAVPGYELLGEVGRGGMAVVHKARHLQLNRIVALKMLLARDAEDAPQLKRFRAEGRMVARLRHPSIVQIYEVGEHDGRPFFSLEYLEGGTLGESLKGHPQPPRQAAAVIEQLARAVQYAHEEGVVHRDIKPANVLLTPDGTPKLADFGLARETRVDQRVTQSGLVIGTPSYMAPEQAQGSSQQVGPAADIHALGVLLYEMLCGHPPFRGATLLDTLVQVMNHEAESLSRLCPGLPRDLATICHHCLEKDPLRATRRPARSPTTCGAFSTASRSGRGGWASWRGWPSGRGAGRRSRGCSPSWSWCCWRGVACLRSSGFRPVSARTIGRRPATRLRAARGKPSVPARMRSRPATPSSGRRPGCSSTAGWTWPTRASRTRVALDVAQPPPGSRRRRLSPYGPHQPGRLERPGAWPAPRPRPSRPCACRRR